MPHTARLAVLALAGALAAAPALAQQRDGTPGNPPSTATQRAYDRATGQHPTPPDGTPGNPSGTAAGRATDRALGTDMSGAHPENERSRGTAARNRATGSETTRVPPATSR